MCHWMFVFQALAALSELDMEVFAQWREAVSIWGK